jgi:hypothetical protein
VRFEFAGRAHRREFTPKLEIKRKENKVKEKEENSEKNKKDFTTEGTERSAEGEGRFWRTAPGGVAVRVGRDSLVSDVAAISSLRTATRTALRWR